MWKAWVNALLGIWIFIVAFFDFSATAIMWNNIIVGIIVAGAGYLMVKEKPWQGWLSVVVGVWLFIAAFIPSLVVGAGNVWNLLISGILLMVAGFGAMGGNKQQVETE